MPRQLLCIHTFRHVNANTFSCAFVHTNKPHVLQVVGLGLWPRTNTSCLNSKRHLLLNDVSFEIRGGEVMAVMATSEEEGTALLDCVAGFCSPVIGDILLNGHNAKANMLKARVAYVQSDPHLCEEMTVLHTLKYHHDLKRPTDKLGYLKIDAMDRVSKHVSTTPFSC